jgi:hypothetical protein
LKTLRTKLRKKAWGGWLAELVFNALRTPVSKQGCRIKVDHSTGLVVQKSSDKVLLFKTKKRFFNHQK